MKILFFILLMTGVSAQGKVNNFPDKKLHVSLGVEAQDFILDLKDDETSQVVTYKPNLLGLYVPRISYDGIIGLSWGFKAPAEFGSEYMYGDTKYTDIRFDFAFSNFTINTHYSQYQGFYLENSTEIDPSITNEMPRIQRPDLYARSVGVAMTWVWNEKKFSLPGLINQSARQEVSGGSYLFGGSISESHFRANSSVIPTSVQGQYSTLGLVKKGQFKTIEAKGGYGYTWAGKWFFGFAVQLGPGLTRRVLEFETGVERGDWDPSLRSEVLLSGGYNGDIFFSTLKIDFRNSSVLLSGANVSTQLVSSALTLGVHLDAIGI